MNDNSTSTNCRPGEIAKQKNPRKDSDGSSEQIESQRNKTSGDMSTMRHDAEHKPIQRHVVFIGADEHRVTESCFYGLRNDPDLYVRGQRFCRIASDEDKPPYILTVPIHDLRRRLTQYVCLQHKKNGRETEPAHPPEWLPLQISHHPDMPGIRPLSGVTETPIVRFDGSIHSTPGYDSKTNYFYHPGGLVVDDIPVSPTRDDARKAATELISLIDDFPIRSGAERSVWLSIIMSIMARHLFTKPAPGHLADANVRSSGKGKFIQCAIIIATGRSQSGQTYDDCHIETNKVIASAIERGDAMIYFDNLKTGSAFGNPALDMALTTENFRARKLKTNETIDGPMKISFLATGNNISLKGDAARRWLKCRIQSESANPEDRDDFKHPNLEQHIEDNRGRYVALALTILSGYLKAGRPNQRLRPAASFEQWSDIVRSAIVWSGQSDPWETVVASRSEVDEEVNEHLALLEAWSELDCDGKGMTAVEAAKLYNENGQPSYPVTHSFVCQQGWKSFDPKQAQYLLRKYKERLSFDHRFLDGRDKNRTGAIRWKVRRAEDAEHAEDVFSNRTSDKNHQDVPVLDLSSASSASSALAESDCVESSDWDQR